MNSKFALAMVCCFGSFELSASKLLSDKVVLFELKPQVCIVKRMGDECGFTAQLKWQTTEPMDLCLTQQQQVLQCWNDQYSVSQRIDLLLQQSSLLSLVDQHRTPLATEQLQVNAIQPKKKRRRLRSAWSLF